MADESESGRSLNPAALSLADAARILGALSRDRVSRAMLEEDVAAGAPSNSDGTLNLVHYAAWLVQQAALRNPQPLGADASSQIVTDNGLTNGD